MYNSEKYNSEKQVGKYNSAQVSREIQVREYKSNEIFENTNRGKHKSENNNSEHTIRNIQIGKY